MKPQLSQALLACILSLTLIFPPPVVAGLATAAAADAPTEVSFAPAADLVKLLRKNVNRSAFDLDTLLETLDYDHQNIVSFVRDRIAYEAYEGLLRGPRGTLMSQAGNTLDQAVLLAKLLNDAGYDARVVRGKLAEAERSALTREMARTHLPTPPLGDVEAALAVLEARDLVRKLTEEERQQIADKLNKEPDIRSMAEYAQFEETTERLTERLNLADRPMAGDQSGLTPGEEGYFWVEYRAEAAQPWEAVHPAFSSPGSAPSPQAESVMSDSVPEAMQHRLRVQMYIERRVGGQLETLPVSDPWERPVANLSGAALTFGALPNTLFEPGSSALSPTKVAERSSFFIPIFGGRVAEGARYFDLLGNIIDPIAATAAASGVFQQVGEAFGKALGELGNAEDVPALTAHWIDLTVLAPGGNEQSYRRFLFDRIGPAKRAEGRVDDPLEQLSGEELLAFLRSNTLMVSTGRTPRSLALDSVLEEFQEDRTAIDLLLSGQSSPDIGSSGVDAMTGHWVGHLSLMSRFDLVERWSERLRIYRDGPMLAIHSSGPAGGNKTMARVDIVSNPRRALELHDDGFKPSPGAMIAAGVWETLVEGSYLASSTDQKNTARVLDAARRDDISVLTVTSPDQLAQLTMSDDARSVLAAEIERGFYAVVPESTPSGLAQTGWWRVHPETGQTLGQLDDGRGVEITEYHIIVGFGVVGYLLLKYQLYQCYSDYAAKNPGSSQEDFGFACCILFNYATFGIGAALGVGIAAKLGEASAGTLGLTFDFFDITTGLDGRFCGKVLK